MRLLCQPDTFLASGPRLRARGAEQRKVGRDAQRQLLLELLSGPPGPALFLHGAPATGKSAVLLDVLNTVRPGVPQAGGSRDFVTPLPASPDPLREPLYNLSLRESLSKLCVGPPHTRPCGPQVRPRRETILVDCVGCFSQKVRKKDAVWAQKLGRLQPFPPECMRQLASSGPT